MKTVYIVIEHIPYEGDTVMRVYENKDDAEAYADELTAEDALSVGGGYFEYRVIEEKLWPHVPAWSLANDDHR
jgi:hypothetical protein